MTGRDLVVRLDGQDPATADLWAEMLRLCMREQAVVAVVCGDPQAGTDWTFEGVLLEVERGFLRVQPVDAEGVPAAATEYVARSSVDHVVVYGKVSPGLLASYDGAAIQRGEA